MSALPSPPHQFRNPQLEQVALTHRSFGSPHNERLEWLGDAIVEFEVSRLLYERFSAVNEGGLSMLRMRLVSGAALATLARRLQLGSRARLGKTEINKGRDNDKLLAGLMEAYVAAVYLDGGDTRALLTALWAEDIGWLEAQVRKNGIRALADAKTRLQEAVQAKGQPAPTYRLTAQSGKKNAPVFQVLCEVGKAGEVRGNGSGSSRAAAEQAAAADCLAQLAQIADAAAEQTT